MIDVVDYIKLVLNKKGWTQQKLCDEVNKIEIKLGDSRTTKHGISSYMNKGQPIGVKMLVKIEKALDLPNDTLMNMVEGPLSKLGKKDLEEVKKKVRG